MNRTILQRLERLESAGLSGDAVALLDQIEDGRWELIRSLPNGKQQRTIFQTEEDAVMASKKFEDGTVIIVDV